LNTPVAGRGFTSETAVFQTAGTAGVGRCQDPWTPLRRLAGWTGANTDFAAGTENIPATRPGP